MVVCGEKIILIEDYKELWILKLLGLVYVIRFIELVVVGKNSVNLVRL